MIFGEIIAAFSHNCTCHIRSVCGRVWEEFEMLSRTELLKGKVQILHVVE